MLVHQSIGRRTIVLWPSVAAVVVGMAAGCARAQHVSPRFDWMPPESVGDASRPDVYGPRIIPEIIITPTPKPTADLGKYTKEYVLDLAKFNISNAGVNAIDTSNGLNAALQYAKTIEANRIVFPKGTYLISETIPIVFDHKNTVVDLNGATLQIRTNGAPRYVMVEIVDGAENFRLTHGVLRGDRDTHDMLTQPGSHEGCELMKIYSGKNMEIDHLTLANAPGFCVASRATGNRTRPELLAMIVASVRSGDLEPGGYSARGEKVASDTKLRTKKSWDTTKCRGQFEFGCGGLGYQGYPYIKGRAYQVYFYDKDDRFLEMKQRLQYKKVSVPKNARTMRFEFNQPAVGGAPNVTVARITNFRPPRDVHFHDNHIVGNRALGMAYCGGQRWLMENNVFEKNGPDVVGWGFDFEDGWELMQHVVLRNNIFKGNLRGDLVICAGSELLFEGNTFTGNVVIHGRPHNYVFRNNKFTGGHIGYTTRTGVAKIHDNTYRDCTISITFDTKAVADGLYRQPGKSVPTPPLTLENETLVNVKKITGTYFNFIGATIEDGHFVVGESTRLVNFKNCRFDNSSMRFEAAETPVPTAITGCQGDLAQDGPGLKRRAPLK